MIRDLDPIDPFDLPEWLVGNQVTWRPDEGLRAGHLITGALSAVGNELPCDLLAVDEAYPRPVTDDQTRTRSHQAWRHGEVLVTERQGRITLAIPGRDFTADRVLEALGRLARAVGATPDDYSALLRLGA